MIASEREFLKAHRKLEELVESVRGAGREGRRMDEVERMLFAELLALGHHLIAAYVASAGNGNVGQRLDVPIVAESTTDGRARPNESAGDGIAGTRRLRRLGEPRTRRHVSIFGELTITRFVYGTREGQKPGRAGGA